MTAVENKPIFSNVKRWFVGLGLTLLVTSCLTPPGARKTDSMVPTVAAKTMASPSQSLGDFSRDSAALWKGLKVGWNLGNCLDVPDSETGWGNPKANVEIMKAVAKAGFKVVRIPVTWSRRMTGEPDYTIDPEWMARVEEVVGYAREAGLYSIINVHHDGADGLKGVTWINLKDMDGNTTDANNAAVKDQFIKVWKQIAKYFSNQGEELIFESMNEIHDGYGKPDPRHYTFINELNQTFVDLVRSSGGNNGKRHLIVPGYNTNIDQTLEGFKIPTDPTKNRLTLSVHYYDPYLFALMAKTQTWGTGAPGRDDWGQEDFVVEKFDKLKAQYIDKGLPMIIGEYGAVQQDGYEEYRRYYMEYVTKAAVDRGLVPIYWDNGGRKSGADNFAIFDRDNNSVHHPYIVDAIMRAVNKTYTLKDVARPSVKKK
jgi:aryl-phospho-beta-D-glucosidase BglC (GH1 family)